MGLMQWIAALELGLIYALVALAVYISFKLIDFADLTVDGTFTLGAGLTAILIISGVHPIIATAIAILAGGVAGVITGFLNVYLRIMSLLAGILTMIALYSINLRIMNAPNLSIFALPNLFSHYKALYVIGILVLLIWVMFSCFLSTQFGLALRAIGVNHKVSRACGINIGTMTIVALAISNALVALAGSLFAQLESFADISMGTGTIIVGLAAVIIGESLVKSDKVLWLMFGCILGSILYRITIALALNANFLRSSDLNLITSFIVVMTLMISLYRKQNWVK